MEMFTLKMHGRGAEDQDLYRSYYLVTDGGHMAGLGRASVVPLSKDAPMPPEHHVEVRQGGEEMALKQLVDMLMTLPGNQGLVAELRNNPT